jgi:isocitrate/isopropylmalate dehydrogenase
LCFSGSGSGSISSAMTASPAGKRKNIAESVAGSTPGTSGKRIRTPTAKMLEAICSSSSSSETLSQGAVIKRGKATTLATIGGATAVTPTARVNSVETGLEVWQTEEFRTSQVKFTGALL